MYAMRLLFWFATVTTAWMLGSVVLAETVLAKTPSEIVSFTRSHCIDCHSGESADGGLNFDTLGFNLDDEEVARRWILARDRVQAGEMPPEDSERPAQAEASAFLSSLTQAIVKAEAKRNDVVLRRLNRHEYENTVSDLFQTEIQVHGLPEDSSTNGFDTVGEGLAVSAEAMAAYLAAADQVLDAAFGTAEEPKFVRHETNLLDQVDWRGKPQLASQYGKMFRKTDEGIVIFQSNYCPTNLVNFSRLKMPAGTYRGTIRVRAIQSDKPVTMRIYGGDTIVNRRERHLVGYYDVPPDKWTTIEFTDRLVQPGGTYQPKCYGTQDTRKNADTYDKPGIEIGDIVIEGPIDVWPPPGRKFLLGDIDPETAGEAEAKEVIDRVLPLAFRRPVEPDEATAYLELYQAAAKDRSFEEALRVSLKAILCSPDFLFLMEEGESQITEYASASRLSYFLWSSMPDEELTTLAKNGTLREPKVLHDQVERMLNSPKAVAFTKNFTGQWLELREINFTEPDSALYPEFDELLRISMVKETESFFNEVLEKNLSLVNFVDSDFTFLNGRLASHYEIDGVAGQELRKVTLPHNSPRGGVLTQASILKVTANGTYTSPVLRGVWILEKILGQPTSPPPDNVGSIEPDIRGATTIREKLEKHRDIQSCAACHRKIDPPGFALESFDPIGGFRNEYRTMAKDGKHPGLKQAPFTFSYIKYRLGQPVDATGKMPSGQPFEDIKEFKKILAANPELLTRNLARQLMTYALGRKIGFSDRPAVTKIVAQTRQQEFGFRSLIHAIVQSPAFHKP